MASQENKEQGRAQLELTHVVSFRTATRYGPDANTRESCSNHGAVMQQQS